jgi:hypothetical protein
MRRADNLTTFMHRFSRNSGASTSWNPKGLSRPVAGNLYLITKMHCCLLSCSLNMSLITSQNTSTHFDSSFAHHIQMCPYTAWIAVRFSYPFAPSVFSSVLRPVDYCAQLRCHSTDVIHASPNTREIKM